MRSIEQTDERSCLNSVLIDKITILHYCGFSLTTLRSVKFHMDMAKHFIHALYPLPGPKSRSAVCGYCRPWLLLCLYIHTCNVL